MTGNGGSLQIMPSNPALNIQVGGTAQADNLFVGTGSLANLLGGFDQVVIGGGNVSPGQDIALDGTLAPVVFQDGLVLNVSGPGSVISVAGQLMAEALETRAAVLVNGSATLSAGNAGLAGGDMRFNESIDGATGNDQLTLAAGGDSIVFGGPVGAVTPLASLTIGGAANVTFTQAVTVTGDVVINATGVVRFDSLLTLESGSLVISGASEVIIGDVVLQGVNGQFIVQANTLTLQGDVTGATNVVLRPSDIGRDIVVGGDVAGAFNISAEMLQHLSSAQSLVIGVQGADGHAAAGAGSVTLAPLDLSAITAAPVKVFGASITLAPGAGILSASSITLDGTAGVFLQDSVSATAGDIVLFSDAGRVSMAAGTALQASAAVVLDASGELAVANISAVNVVLRSASGSIVDVNADDATNIVAGTVSLYGYGSPVGTGNPIEVQAPQIYLAARTGVELQDTGPDGRTHFYVLDGATMYEQAVGIGQVVRQTQDPTPTAVSAAVASDAMAMAAPLSAASWFPTTVHGESRSVVASYLAGSGAAERTGNGLVASGAQGLGKNMDANVALEFDLWLADLVV